MNSEDKDLDRHFQQEAEQLDIPPSPAAWPKLERRLQRRSSRDSRRTVFRPLTWAAAAVALLVIAVSVFTLLPRPASILGGQSIELEFVHPERSLVMEKRLAEAYSWYQISEPDRKR